MFSFHFLFGLVHLILILSAFLSFYNLIIRISFSISDKQRHKLAFSISDSWRQTSAQCIKYKTYWRHARNCTYSGMSLSESLARSQKTSGLSLKFCFAALGVFSESDRKLDCRYCHSCNFISSFNQSSPWISSWQLFVLYVMPYPRTRLAFLRRNFFENHIAGDPIPIELEVQVVLCLSAHA